MDYVILAGGHGLRFAKEGYEVPKPLVHLSGRPMIGVVIERLMECGAGRIIVGANAGMPQLVQYLEHLGDSGLPVEVRPVLTDNSYHTLKEASAGIDGKFIALTCDAIFPVDEFKKYINAFSSMSEETALMGLTRFVEDESPLYARIGSDGEIIDYRYGGSPFEGEAIVSAGLYGLSGKIMEIFEFLGLNPASVSDFQRMLAAASPVKVRPFEFSIAFDVDTSRDLFHAQAYLENLR